MNIQSNEYASARFFMIKRKLYTSLLALGVFSTVADLGLDVDNKLNNYMYVSYWGLLVWT